MLPNPELAGIYLVIFALIALLIVEAPYIVDIPILGEIILWAASIFPLMMGIGMGLHVLIFTRNPILAGAAGLITGVIAWIVLTFV